jgi:hypothetical protein
MALIRVIVGESDHRKWIREDSTASQLMKHFFGADGSPISVYSVTSGIEETKAVAAHYLTLARQYFGIVSALRIELKDLNGLEIVIEATPGDTGIADVDGKHRDLAGDKVKFEAMTRRHSSRRRSCAHRRRDATKAPSTRVPEAQQ